MSLGETDKKSKNPPTNISQGDSFLNQIKFFYCVSGALLVSDSCLWGCRPKAVHHVFVYHSALLTCRKMLLEPKKTTFAHALFFPLTF